jgi:hypothetical protein
MVGSASCGDIASHIFVKNKRYNYMENCVICEDYEIQLKEALSELSLAHVIIRLLQNELIMSTTSKRADGNILFSTSNMGVRVDNNKEWTRVSPKKKHIEKSNKRSKGEIVSIGHLITTTNCFTLLHNLDNQADRWEGQECSEWILSTKNITKVRKQHNSGVRIPTIINGRIINSGNRNPSLLMKKTTHVAGSKWINVDNNVRIIGDSHLRDTAARINQYFNAKFEVCGLIKPGANTKQLVDSLSTDFQ